MFLDYFRQNIVETIFDKQDSISEYSPSFIFFRVAEFSLKFF